MKLTRRALLAAASAAVLDSCTDRTLSPYDRGFRDASGERDAALGERDPEALVVDPDGILDLPDGFSYSIVQRVGDAMSDGYRVPDRADGMGCFEGEDGAIVLARNHELRESDADPGPYFAGQMPPEEAYDALTLGAVTRVVLDPDSLQLRSSNLVLAGTSWNCSGGVSPWGWLSCEETVAPGHGFVFLCDPSAGRVQPFQRIDGYGRFRHEAAAVDPETLIAYLTEDQTDAAFYRFLPHDKAQPFEGVLQALCIVDQPEADTGTLAAGERLAVAWVDIDDPTPATDSVRSQARAKGAAIFRRTEGIWFGGDAVFMSCTSGGREGFGQILRLTLGDDAKLETLVESRDPSMLSGPDNLCASPLGTLFVAEDAPGYSFVRSVSTDGRVATLARNAADPTEIAGPCFSPDGRTLFLNLQVQGLTVAIRGPFDDEGALGARARRTPHSSGLAVLARNAYRRRG